MPETISLADEIAKLKKLLDDGILTQEEFDAQKKRLLESTNQTQPTQKTKFCKFCAESIDFDCIICPKCGKQVEEIKTNANAPINVNVNQNQSSANTNSNSNIHTYGPGVGIRGGAPKDKWVAVLLCFFFGWLGMHKFYEGRILLGVIYIFTCGLFFIGWGLDFIILLTKPNPYYV